MAQYIYMRGLKFFVDSVLSNFTYHLPLHTFDQENILNNNNETEIQGRRSSATQKHYFSRFAQLTTPNHTTQRGEIFKIVQFIR